MTLDAPKISTTFEGKFKTLNSKKNTRSDYHLYVGGRSVSGVLESSSLKQSRILWSRFGGSQQRFGFIKSGGRGPSVEKELSFWRFTDVDAEVLNWRESSDEECATILNIPRFWIQVRTQSSNHPGTQSINRENQIEWLWMQQSWSPNSLEYNCVEQLNLTLLTTQMIHKKYGSYIVQNSVNSVFYIISLVNRKNVQNEIGINKKSSVIEQGQNR